MADVGNGTQRQVLKKTEKKKKKEQEDKEELRHAD